MKAIYKPLGQFIHEVDVRNSNLAVTKLMGVNLNKTMMPSVANIIGTDLSNYKIVKENQFACKLMSIGRDACLPIALKKDSEPVIISSAYYSFEVNNEQEILSDYLMICFLRPSFDKELWFKSGGDVRGGITWDDFCLTKIPYISIDEQRKVVHEYLAIKKRINLLKEINENLLSQAITLIKGKIGIPILIDKPKDVIADITKQGKRVISLKDFCKNMATGSTPSRTNDKYWSSPSIPWLKSGEVHNGFIFNVEEYVSNIALKETSIKLFKANSVVLAMYGATASEVGYLCMDTTSNQAICNMECETFAQSVYLYYSLITCQSEIAMQAIGGAQNNLSKEIIENFKIVAIDDNIIHSIGLLNLFNLSKLYSSEINILENVCRLLISNII